MYKQKDQKSYISVPQNVPKEYHINTQKYQKSYLDHSNFSTNGTKSAVIFLHLPFFVAKFTL